MGDRTDCFLTLATPASAELQQIIKANLGYPLITQSFEFEDVNYANIPVDLYHHLHANHLPFIWQWAAGGEYGPGIYIYDGSSSAEYPLDYDGNIILTLNEASDPKQLTKARKWQDRREEIERE